MSPRRTVLVQPVDCAAPLLSEDIQHQVALSPTSRELTIRVPSSRARRFRA